MATAAAGAGEPPRPQQGEHRDEGQSRTGEHPGPTGPGEEEPKGKKAKRPRRRGKGQDQRTQEAAAQERRGGSPEDHPPHGEAGKDDQAENKPRGPPAPRGGPDNQAGGDHRGQTGASPQPRRPAGTRPRRSRTPPRQGHAAQRATRPKRPRPSTGQKGGKRGGGGPRGANARGAPLKRARAASRTPHTRTARRGSSRGFKKEKPQRAAARGPPLSRPSFTRRGAKRIPGGHPGISIQIHWRPTTFRPWGSVQRDQRCSSLLSLPRALGVELLDRACPGLFDVQNQTTTGGGTSRASTREGGDSGDSKRPPRTRGRGGKILFCCHGPVGWHLYVLSVGQKQGAYTRQNTVKQVPFGQIGTYGR